MPIDDARIDHIAREVLSSLRRSRAETPGAVTTAAEAGLPPGPSATPAPAPDTRPARPSFHLQLLSVEGGVIGSPCVIEPDKICDGSERCRSLGH